MIFYYMGTVFYSFTLLVTPITEDLGWSTTVISQGFLISGVIGAVLAPVFGTAFDRFGPKMVVAGGLVAGAVGFLLVSWMTTSWHFYIAWTLAGIGPVVIYNGAVPAVANWFVRMRGRALGLTIIGEGLGGFVAPVMLVLVNLIGWRGAVTVVAVGIIVFLLPLVLVLRRRPEDYGQLPDGAARDPCDEDLGEASDAQEIEGLTLQEALRTKAFWGLAFVFALGFLPIGGTTVHLSPFLEGGDVSRGIIAAVLTFMAVGAISGQLGGGWLVDRMDPRRVAAGALGLQAFGLAALSQVTGDGQWLLILFVAGLAPGFGGVTVLWPALLGIYFGRRSFGSIQGVLWTITAGAFAAAPLTLGWLSEVLDGYPSAILIYGALSGIGATACFRLPRPGQFNVSGQSVRPETSATA
jgi:MFS family permease